MRQPRSSLGFITTIALLASPASLRAQGPDDDGWVGKDVVQKSVEFALKLDDGVVEGSKGRTPIYRVKSAIGPWLLLEARGLQGFAMATDVVPVDRAIEHFTVQIRDNPDDWFAYTMRASIRRDVRGEYDLALGDYNEAIRVNPTSTAYYNRGNIWYFKKDCDRAIADYSEAIRLDTKYVIALYNRGVAWGDKKEYDRAIDDQSEAIRLDPKFANSYINRANAWSAKKDYNRAIADHNEAIRLDPDSAHAYNNRGSVLQLKREYEGAIADYDEAIRLDPKFAHAHYGRGLVYCDLKEFDRAIADFDTAIRLDPDYAKAYYNRGNARLAKKEFDRAIADYGEAIRVDPKFTPAHNNRGGAWYAKGDCDRAILEFGAAIRVDPNHVGAYYNRGLALVDKKEYVRAIVDFNEAIRLNSYYPSPHYGLALVSLLSDGSRSEPEARAALELAGWSGGYASSVAIVGHLGARRAKQDGAASRLLDDAAEKCDTSAWPYPIVRFLRRQIDEKALLELATDGDKRTIVRCSLGLDLALAGRPEEARGHLLWVKEHAPATNPYYTIALAELDRLDARPEP